MATSGVSSWPATTNWMRSSPASSTIFLTSSNCFSLFGGELLAGIDLALRELEEGLEVGLTRDVELGGDRRGCEEENEEGCGGSEKL